MKTTVLKLFAFITMVMLCSIIVAADTIVDTSVEFTTNHTFTDPTTIDNSTVLLNNTDIDNQTLYGNFTGDVNITDSEVGGNWLTYLIFENANVTIENSFLFNASVICYNSTLSILNSTVDSPIAKDRRVYALELYNTSIYMLNSVFVSSNGLFVENSTVDLVLSRLEDAESYALEAYNSTINLDGIDTSYTFGFYVENCIMNATVLSMNEDEMMLQSLNSTVDLRSSNINLADGVGYSITAKKSRIMTSASTLDFGNRNGLRVQDSDTFFFSTEMELTGDTTIHDTRSNTFFANDRPQFNIAQDRNEDNSTVSYGISTDIVTIFDPLVAQHITTYYLSGVPVTISADGITYNFTTNDTGVVESRAIVGESIGWDDDIIRRTERAGVHNTPIIVSYTINSTDLKVKEYEIGAKYEGNELSRTFNPREDESRVIIDFGDYVQRIPKDSWTIFSLPLDLNITSGYLFDSLDSLGYNMKVITIYDTINNRYIPLKAGEYEERDYVIDAFTVLMFLSDSDYIISFQGERRDNNTVEIGAGKLRAIGLSHEMTVQDIYATFPEIAVITYYDSTENKFIDLKQTDEITLSFGTVVWIIARETVTVSL